MIGVDIIEISRVRKAIESRAFVDRVYTPREQLYCDARGAGRAASYAARWAGKEAVMKALGTGLSGGRMTEIEIFNDDGGAPHVTLTGNFKKVADNLSVRGIELSLSHSKEYAVAAARLSC